MKWIRIIVVILTLSVCSGCANINRALTSDLNDYDKHATYGEQVVAAPFILVRLAAGFAVGVAMSPVFIAAIVYDGATEQHSTTAKTNGNVVETTPLASLTRMEKELEVEICK